jgi:UDP-glucose 4-epimerase
LNPKKILITGGSGFIGRNLVHYQKLLGRQVTVFDLKPFPETSSNESRPDREIIGNISDTESITQAAAGHDAIVHLAAQTGVPGSIEDPEFDCVTNVLGTLRVLEAARHSNIGKVIVASSAAPLGRAEPPASEQSVPLPVSPYGASKLAGEAYCLAYNGSFGLNTIALRFSNVYGPRAGHKTSVVAKFMKDILVDAQINIDGTGEQTRDFIFVGDLCSAIDKALLSDVGGEIFQIGSGIEISISQLAEMIVEGSGRGTEISYQPARIGDVERNYSDISKAKSILNWTPQMELNEGINKTWEWFNNAWSKD